MNTFLIRRFVHIVLYAPHFQPVSRPTNGPLASGLCSSIHCTLLWARRDVAGCLIIITVQSQGSSFHLLKLFSPGKYQFEISLWVLWTGRCQQYIISIQYICKSLTLVSYLGASVKRYLSYLSISMKGAIISSSQCKNKHFSISHQGPVWISPEIPSNKQKSLQLLTFRLLHKSQLQFFNRNLNFGPQTKSTQNITYFLFSRDFGLLPFCPWCAALVA